MTKKPDSAVFGLKFPDMFQTSSLTKGEQTIMEKRNKQNKQNETKQVVPHFMSHWQLL